MKSSLENKTVRPGSLGNYSFYYSNRSLPRAAAPVAQPVQKRSGRSKYLGILSVVLLVVVFAGTHMLGGNNAADSKPQVAATAPASTTAKPVNQCSGNTEEHWVRISVSKRHLWACNGTTQMHDSKVITGMEKYPSTLTPVGTYKIYAKAADTVLTGSDETGAWRDPVSYWMPFLDNQYGTYGFHDATWRTNDEFGAVDPNGDKASHGCVELPLATSKWLYGWAPVGTVVTVEA